MSRQMIVSRQGDAVVLDAQATTLREAVKMAISITYGDFSRLDVSDWDFLGKDLYGSRWSLVTACRANFASANFSNARAFHSNFQGASFNGARLGYVRFDYCDLRGCDFRNCMFDGGTAFYRCDLTGVAFDRRNLTRNRNYRPSFDECTGFVNPRAEHEYVEL